MTRSLRRSRRGSAKKNSEYNVGDIVEINRGGVVLNGRLAQLLTEGTSPNPRWLLKFDGQPQKDEEMYERSFVRLVTAAEDDVPSANSPISSPSSQRRSGKPNGSGIVTSGSSSASRRSGGSKASGTSSEGEVDDSKVSKMSRRNSNSKKQVSFSEGSNIGSDYSSTPETDKKLSARDKVSAREERSRRRQAKIDEETVPSSAYGEDSGGGGKRRLPPPNHSKKRQRPSEDGEVVKVKLLTGTLYLYRGQHRRVEFIRRV